MVMEGRLFVEELSKARPTLDELRDRGVGLPRRGVLDAYLLRTRGSAAKYEVGAWAWALHRLTGLAMVGYVVAHIFLLLSVANAEELRASILAHSPYYEVVMVLAITALTFHSLNGLRLVLGDGGVLPMRAQHKVAIWVVAGLSLLAMLGTLVRVLS